MAITWVDDLVARTEEPKIHVTWYDRSVLENYLVFGLEMYEMSKT